MNLKKISKNMEKYFGKNYKISSDRMNTDGFTVLNMFGISTT